MQITLGCDSFGRVAGTIAHNDVRAVVTSADAASAVSDLQEAVEAALADGFAECFWHEANGDYRWLFRRKGAAMHIAIAWSAGTLTGWEYRFFTECDAANFRTAILAAIEASGAFHAKS